MLDYNKLPIGISNFSEIIEQGCIYIDKTMFVKEIMDNRAKVILLTRPRRFGKTLAMTMLGEFLSLSGKDVFGGLQVAREEEFCAKHQNQYPVIFISFKDCKDLTFEGVFEQVKETFKDCYAQHKYLLESQKLSPEEIADFKDILYGKINDPHVLSKALKSLTAYIHAHTGKNSVILIDEYDSPIHSAYAQGFYEQMVAFMRKTLGSALKDNIYLEKSVLTGICRVSQESLFSGLNHVQTYTVLDEGYAQYFGFTQDEVDTLLPPPTYYQETNPCHPEGQSPVGSAFRECHVPAVIDASPKGDPSVACAPQDDKGLSWRIKNWYNGYVIGGLRIYNPWSILECLSKNCIIMPYWVNTSDNSLVHTLIDGSRKNVKEQFEELIAGIPQHKVISNNLAFKYLENDDGAIWTLLIHAGYLNVISKTISDENGEINAVLEIPNKEVMSVYTTMVKNWFTTPKYSGGDYENLVKALETGNIDAFARQIQNYILESGSYFDFTKHTPERVFHAFMLGILVGMRGRYDITSNRERGLGRADMVMVPKDASKHSIVLEFKSCNDPLALEKEAESALTQIKQKHYATTPSTIVSMVFCGKEMVYKHEKA